MKKLLLVLLASVFAFVGAANAAPVARTADLTLVVTIQGLPGIVITGSNQIVTVDSVAKTLAIASSAVFQTAPITIPVTATTAIASVKGTGLLNFGGTFSNAFVATTPATEVPCPSVTPLGPLTGCVTANPTKLGGQMGLSGTVFAVIVPMLVTVPIPMTAAGIGVGGATVIPPTPAGFVFDAAPWTAGLAKVGFAATSTWTAPQIFHTPGSANFTVGTSTFTNSWTTTAFTNGAGGVSATPSISGAITLVSPTYVNALGNLLPVFAVLTVHFVPEPGTLLLLGAGLGGLVLVGRRRR